MGGFSVTGSGFTAKGINPSSPTTPAAALREVDSRGALLQGSYSWGKNRLALSYGKTVDDGNGLGSAADYESRGIAYFRTINDNLAGRRAEPLPDRRARRCRARRGHRHRGPRRRTELVIPLLSKDPAATQVG